MAAALSLAFLTLCSKSYLSIYVGFLSFFDKAGTTATHTTNLFEIWSVKYFFTIALPLIMLLALFWGKRWPQGSRDPVSAVLLCTL